MVPSTALASPIFEAPLWLERALQGPTAAIGLPALASVAHIAIVSCAVSFLLQRLSHFLCPILFPKYYPTLKPKQHDWDLHVVRSFLL